MAKPGVGLGPKEDEPGLMNRSPSHLLTRGRKTRVSGVCSHDPASSSSPSLRRWSTPWKVFLAPSSNARPRLLLAANCQSSRRHFLSWVPEHLWPLSVMTLLYQIQPSNSSHNSIHSSKFPLYPSYKPPSKRHSTPTRRSLSFSESPLDPVLPTSRPGLATRVLWVGMNYQVGATRRLRQGAPFGRVLSPAQVAVLCTCTGCCVSLVSSSCRAVVESALCRGDPYGV